MPIVDVFSLHKENLQLVNQWEINFIPSMANRMRLNLPSTGGTELRYLAKSVNIPDWKFATETHASGMKYIKNIERDLDISIEFYETENFTVRGFLEKWKRAIFDRNTMNFNSEFPLLDIEVQFVGAEESKRFSFYMTGCMIKDVDEYTLTYEEGEVLLTKGNFTCNLVSML